ncbi:uncharacterized protein TNCV_4264601 [Trichonephila clavipes]|nr:uncharacterized protein TNCV_4264601 [Trichonephila clavipes]
MFKNCRKEDLRIVALGETVAEKELIQYTIEDRKKAEETRLREKELELASLNVRVNSDNERTGESCNSLDALVKSVRILTVKGPNRPEGWAFFFASLERAFVSKNVPEKFKESAKPGSVKNSTFEPLNTPVPVNSIYNIRSDAKRREHCGFIQATDNLELSIKKFWEIENVEIDSVKNSELDIFEDHFKNTHSRDDRERYTVAMPLKEDHSCLGESKQTAIQRLNSLWKRLSREKEYLFLYEKFLKEYEDLSHMREIKADGSGVACHTMVFIAPKSLQLN